MINKIDDILENALKKGPKRLAVACAQDDSVLMAIEDAAKRKLVTPILVGDKSAILEIAKSKGISLEAFEIIDAPDKQEACDKAAKLVRDGKADLIMKGITETANILKAVLSKENELRTDKKISHVLLLEIEKMKKIYCVTDCAMNIAPTLEDKVSICKNAVEVCRALGNDNPKVAVLAAVENVNPKMPCTMDAAELKKMNEEGTISGCVVDGPFALDEAVSEEAAKHKHITSPVCGHADVLLCPDIEAANILDKAMEYFADAKKAGVIMGAKVPVVLTSRASSANAKLNSIALGVLVANN